MISWIVPCLTTVGILSTAVVFGTDVFFFTIGRSALRRASEAAATEVMGFFHFFADARMPIPGALAIISNILLTVIGGSGRRWYYLVSALALILFLVLYTRFSKPINRIQVNAAQTRIQPAEPRELQAAWDRLLRIRVPLLGISLLAQTLACQLPPA